jgi:hypothetical protein
VKVIEHQPIPVTARQEAVAGRDRPLIIDVRRDRGMAYRRRRGGHGMSRPRTTGGGLAAISAGLARNHRDDHAMLRHGLIVYDALYSWCKEGKGEVHTWKPGTSIVC